jgi:hypothetical protein
MWRSDSTAKNVEADLNDLGRDGWELVLQASSSGQYLLKREIEEKEQK